MTTSELFASIFPVLVLLIYSGIKEFFAHRNLAITAQQTVISDKQTTINKNQADVDQQAFNIKQSFATLDQAMQVSKLQSYVMDLKEVVARGEEREKNYIVQITSLQADLKRANGSLDSANETLNIANETLNKSYGVITDLQEQVKTLLTAILSGSKPAAQEAAEKVIAKQDSPSTKPTTPTQAAVETVAASPTQTATMPAVGAGTVTEPGTIAVTGTVTGVLTPVSPESPTDGVPS